jgi:hypothetical protein
MKVGLEQNNLFSRWEAYPEHAIQAVSPITQVDQGILQNGVAVGQGFFGKRQLLHNVGLHIAAPLDSCLWRKR